MGDVQVAYGRQRRATGRSKTMVRRRRIHCIYFLGSEDLSFRTLKQFRLMPRNFISVESSPCLRNFAGIRTIEAPKVRNLIAKISVISLISGNNSLVFLLHKTVYVQGIQRLSIYSTLLIDHRQLFSNYRKGR